MKIVMKGFLDTLRRISDRADGTMCANLEVKGKVVEGHRGPDSQNADAHVQFHAKPLIFEKHPLGNPLFVIITDQDPDAEKFERPGDV